MTGLQYGETWLSMANRALGRLGLKPITSFDEQSKAANHVVLLLGQALSETLAEYDWSFATKRRVLSVNITTPAFDYDYYYDVPALCERFITVDTGGEQWTRDQVGIATNATEVNLVYIERVEDATIMPEAFKTAIETRLAFLLSPYMTENEATVARMGQEQAMALRRAIASDAKSHYQESYADQSGNTWYDGGR
jgi:hypothetical protein